MRVSVRQDDALSLIGDNGRGHETRFDTSIASGGKNIAASPVEILLEAMAACTMMDVIGMLEKSRKEFSDFAIEVDAERAEEHPKYVTAVHFTARLISANTTEQELDRYIALSQEKYCSVSVTVARGGTKITWESAVIAPVTE